MKNKKGITLISLTIYIIVMLIVIGIITTIGIFFYQNVIQIDENSQNLAEFNKFNMYFLEEIKKKGNHIAQINENSVTFTSGETYTYIESDNAIYKNKMKICENIKKCIFTENSVNGKEGIRVYLEIGNKMEFSETIDYVF